MRNAGRRSVLCSIAQNRNSLTLHRIAEMPRPVANANGVRESVCGENRAGGTRHLSVGISAANIERLVEDQHRNLAGNPIARTLLRDHGQFEGFLKAVAAVGQENIKGAVGMPQIAVAVGEPKSNGQGVCCRTGRTLRYDLFVHADEIQHRLNGVVGPLHARGENHGGKSGEQKDG